MHVSAEIINAWCAEIASVLFEELTEKGFIRVGDMSKTSTGILHCINVTLSLEGWEQYEAQKHGAISGNYGFVAMKFNDPDLDPFVKNTVKPAVTRNWV